MNACFPGVPRFVSRLKSLVRVEHKVVVTLG
jgi:hypothetical protein